MIRLPLRFKIHKKIPDHHQKQKKIHKIFLFFNFVKFIFTWTSATVLTAKCRRYPEILMHLRRFHIEIDADVSPNH